MQTKARLAPWQKTGSGPKHTGGVGTCCCRSAATTSDPSISEERYWKASPKSLKQDCMVCWFTSGSRERGGGEGRNGTEVEKATSLNHWLISPQIVEKTCHKREADYALVFLRESSLIHHHWSLPSVADLIKRVKIPPASDDDVLLATVVAPRRHHRRARSSPSAAGAEARAQASRPALGRYPRV